MWVSKPRGLTVLSSKPGGGPGHSCGEEVVPVGIHGVHWLPWPEGSQRGGCWEGRNWGSGLGERSALSPE